MLASEKRAQRLAEIEERLAAERAKPKPGQFPLAPSLCEKFGLEIGYLVDANSFGKLLIERNRARE